MSQRKRHRSADSAAAEEAEKQYAVGGMTLEELDEKFPNRPQNHSRTPAFSELFNQLFNPLNENKKKPTGPGLPRSKAGPHGPSKLSPHEQRRNTIERFISRWRNDVGDDIYPALRLILPDKDRDRGVYGLKESAIGKLLVKLMKIDKNSEDGYNLLHWKLPGQTTASRMAGDFAGRCFEVLSKRPMRTDVGDMTIAQVNEQLDKLAGSSGELENLEVFETFYERMNAEELMWLIRIVLKQMKVGATERTFLNLWHPDAEALFNVTSSLRRVCWELHDPQVRLEQEDTGVSLMQCFQPQLAQFQMPASFQKMVAYLRPTEDDPEYWIEEKLDGERMQMHMTEDPDTPGGRRFCFWSRKAKDYTYLYGNGIRDEQGTLTRHLAGAFADGVRNFILDGEMITWDTESDKIMPFGTLKTAALAEKKNPYNNTGPRPLFRVFDVLYLNDQPLTRYTLRDRHRALERVVPGVHRRLEVHAYEAATSPDAIEPLLRKVVAEASEGLVLKNPRSMYRLNSRNDDWLKVKPDYMTEFGESLDCVVIGGYYGSGRRGGNLSSFMCGLRASEDHLAAGVNPEKCFSFFKVGGGFSVDDYAEIRHRTDGKWVEWDPKRPPSQYVELAAGQAEKPDVWIRPRDSFVVEAKAASVGASDQFALGFTLRFPRLKRIRNDKAWDQGLSVQEFHDLRRRVEEEAHEKTMSIEGGRRRGAGRKAAKRARRDVVVVGTDGGVAAAAAAAKAAAGYGGDGGDHRNDTNNAHEHPDKKDSSKVFNGLEFCFLSESLKPFKKSKAQLEALVTEHGGRVSQRAVPRSDMILVADKNVVKVASLVKQGEKEGEGVDIVRPRWIQDCLFQARGGGGPGGDAALLPYEERHLLHATDAQRVLAEQNADRFGDSYARTVDVEELREILEAMTCGDGNEADGNVKLEFDTAGFDAEAFVAQLQEHGHDLGRRKGNVFSRCVVQFRWNSGASDADAGVVAEPSNVDVRLRLVRFRNCVRFGGGRVVESPGGEGANGGDGEATHVVVVAGGREVADAVRKDLGKRKLRSMPRVVSSDWVEACWKEKTLVDEERFGHV